MAAHTLDIPQSPRDAVFRAMETIVRQNATFQRIVKPISFRTWRGNPEDAKEFTFEIAPAMRWTPQNGPEEFRTPEMQVGPLYVNCELLIKGTNISDMLNFWWMLERCFYPAVAGPNLVIPTLQNAGAFTGLVFFTQPAFDPGPDGVWLAGQGQLKIDVRNDINS